MPAARLILEDGTVYEGESFGSTENAIGEVVFNTSLTGYQEIATDPSYRFQIVTMTYPHIDNYGVEAAVERSGTPRGAGFVAAGFVGGCVARPGAGVAVCVAGSDPAAETVRAKRIESCCVKRINLPVRVRKRSRYEAPHAHSTL